MMGEVTAKNNQEESFLSDRKRSAIDHNDALFDNNITLTLNGERYNLPSVNCLVPAKTSHFNPLHSSHTDLPSITKSPIRMSPYSQTRPASDIADQPNQRRSKKKYKPMTITPSQDNSWKGPEFKVTTQYCDLFDMNQTQKYSTIIHPKMDRGFFLDDLDWTCYRRNYFQMSASWSGVSSQNPLVSIQLPCLALFEAENTVREVTGFMLHLTAKASNGSRSIELVQHTAKRDKGPVSAPQPMPAPPAPPGHETLISHSTTISRTEDPYVVTFGRIQFKSATANNGKRRAAQQYHILAVELLAKCRDGSVVPVAVCESSPLVVRGRAPGHYAYPCNATNTSPTSVTHLDDDHTVISPLTSDSGESSLLLQNQPGPQPRSIAFHFPSLVEHQQKQLANTNVCPSQKFFDSISFSTRAELGNHQERWKEDQQQINKHTANDEGMDARIRLQHQQHQSVANQLTRKEQNETQKCQILDQTRAKKEQVRFQRERTHLYHMKMNEQYEEGLKAQHQRNEQGVKHWPVVQPQGQHLQNTNSHPMGQQYDYATSKSHAQRQCSSQSVPSSMIVSPHNNTYTHVQATPIPAQHSENALENYLQSYNNYHNEQNWMSNEHCYPFGGSG